MSVDKTNAPGSAQPMRFCFMTSGGDCSGMNAAVRAVVRRGLLSGAQPYAIFEGYNGMVSGGSFIRQLQWDDVSGFLEKGGTMIGTSRCPEFRTREGRKKAAENLLTIGIDRLVCIGGDGSLTGADILSREWPEYVEELYKEGKITQYAYEHQKNFYVVGMVGSIDNDMYGTDMTIGAATALHRIIECIDSLMTTAASHQRTFIVEVMGRDCGYLAIASCLATGSDWVIVPEFPNDETWKEKMCKSVKKGRDRGKRMSVIVIAEGARDTKGNPITANEVKQCIEDDLKMEARVTILGHIQRGGTPCFYDRLLSTLMGMDAVEAILEAKPGFQHTLIGVRGSKVVRSPLMEAVRMTQSVAKAIKDGDYEKAKLLRGPVFNNALKTMFVLTRSAPVQLEGTDKRPAFAITHIGAPAPGMNSAVRSATRLLINKGYRPMALYNGIRDILDGGDAPEELQWLSVNGWSNIGGALLGTNRTIPSTDEEFEKIASSFKQYDIKGLLIIGGWEGYAASISLEKNKEKYPEFNIPIICIPATVSNNVPGTDASIGCDTALNCIVESADKVKLSAVASRARVFFLEVMGGNCGYLAVCGSIAGGAQLCYIPEHGIHLQGLANDVERMKKRFKMCKTTSLVVNCERASETYNTEMLSKIFTEEGKGLFDVRHTILGHLQQGYSPSPMDRLRGAEFAQYAVDTLEEQFKSGKPVAGAIGITEGEFEFVPFKDMISNMDFKRRVPKKQRWEHLMGVVDMLRSRPQDDATYRPFSFHLKTVHPDKAPIPSMSDAAYHHHQSTAANLNLLTNVTLDKLDQDAIKPDGVAQVTNSATTTTEKVDKVVKAEEKKA